VTATERAATAHLAGGSLAYVLRRSPRAQTIRLTIYPDRGLVVTVPARVGVEEGARRAAASIEQREGWIRRHLDRHAAARDTIAARGGARDGGCIPFRGALHAVRVVPAVSGLRRSHVVHLAEEHQLIVHRVGAERRELAAVLEPWLREQAREAIELAVAAQAEALKVQPAAITLRDPGSRWGSASRQGRLSFSWRLILAPPEALETVVIHELAHLRVFGHGPGFWALVAERRPDHATWRRWLHDHALELHRALEPV
jgi:predicted metal-dependent hydrolase